jgi:hypothetical protein
MDETKQDGTGPPSAWQAAQDAGFDMSVIEANLELTPWERILNHSRALAMLTELREAMEKYYADT